MEALQHWQLMIAVLVILVACIGGLIALFCLGKIADVAAGAARRGYRIGAVLLIACGVLSSAIHVLNYLDSAPGLFVASGVIEPSSVLVSSLQPKADEWPLIVAKQSEAGRSPENYKVEVGGVRETKLLQVRVYGGSPERTRALATWLTDSFTQSLRNSFTNHGFNQPPEVLVHTRPDSASPIHYQSLVLAFQLLTPCLLLVSGFLLFRLSKPNEQKAGQVSGL
jgi:hypothetical protein